MPARGGRFEESAPGHHAVPPSQERRSVPPAGERGLVSTATTEAVDAAFDTLAQVVQVRNGRTVEELVSELIRPMLKTWLDDNLPGLVERLVPGIWGKPLAMNVSGAIAAVLLDAGYPLLAVKGVPMLARTASLIAHLTEEQQRPIGFILADSGASAIEYDGQRPDGFAPDEG